jgi:hypothetical protein
MVDLFYSGLILANKMPAIFRTTAVRISFKLRDGQLLLEQFA